MIFNSFNFFIFFILFFLLYWFVFNKSASKQNMLLLFGSYVFYAIADWRLLLYLIAVSVFNFVFGLYIEKSKNERVQTLLVRLGLLQGIGGLFYFKYFNFFIEQFNELLLAMNFNISIHLLNIMIPLGISFFTFKTLSYILDIGYGKIEATKNWIIFFNYVAFFPTLLSGPIDRPNSFIPQLEKKRVFEFDQGVDGARQILWGLFKKLLIADKLAVITDPIFNNYEDYSGSSLLYASVFYAIQVYADFSAYSDMAIGFSRLIGFNVTKNFDYPFFAQNIAEFWRKWHMSLTSWMTDYLFTPLAFVFRDFNKVGLLMAIITNFIIIGMWHGANWTFLLYGLIHGLFFIPLVYLGTINKVKPIDTNRYLPSFKEFWNILSTFTLVILSFVIFRSNTIGMSLDIYNKIFSRSLFQSIENIDYLMCLLVILFFLIEWLNRDKNHILENLQLSIGKRSLRWGIYTIILMLILNLGSNSQEFIYFQF